ncbi:MAG: FtsX-like permease family protein [Saprospiraceae bacterium]|nr:FtsX-like permease family protein [Saprospiraceae bacterium]
MSIIKLAWKNIINNPLSLLLSIILFALGIGLISFLLQFNKQVSEKFEANLADIDLVIGAKGSPLQLILSSMYHIDNPTGNIKIEDAKPFLNPNHPLLKTSVPLSLGDNYHSYRIVGTNHDILPLYKAQIDEGNLWHDDLDVTIGHDVAQETGLKVGDKFVSSHGFDHDDDLAHNDSSFKVTGILVPSGTVLDQLILTNTASIWNVHNHESTEDNAENHKHSDEEHEHHDGHTHEDSLHDHDNSNADLLTHPEEQITSILIQYKNKTGLQALNMPRAINENTKLQAASPAYEINKLNNMVGIGTNTLKILGILIAFVSAISIFISLFKSLKDRKYELALIRVMGGSKIKLFTLVILEGLIISIIGFLIGIILSHLGMYFAGNFMEKDFRYSFNAFSFIKEEFLLALASLAIGLISAIIPAIQASNTEINETLSKKNF